MAFEYGYGFDWMHSVFPVLFLIVFVMAIGIIAFSAIARIRTWNQNNNSPRLEVDVKVISKRMDVRHHTYTNGNDFTEVHGHYTTASTTYYVTFEVESGDRMEFELEGTEYGMMVEGDRGKLKFQGRRYLGFERA